MAEIDKHGRELGVVREAVVALGFVKARDASEHVLAGSRKSHEPVRLKLAEIDYRVRVQKKAHAPETVQYLCPFRAYLALREIVVEPGAGIEDLRHTRDLIGVLQGSLREQSSGAVAHHDIRAFFYESSAQLPDKGGMCSRRFLRLLREHEIHFYRYSHARLYPIESSERSEQLIKSS